MTKKASSGGFFNKKNNICVCVGGGPVTSFKVNFNFPKFHGGEGSNICYQGGGRGCQTFSNGVESNC